MDMSMTNKVHKKSKKVLDEIGIKKSTPKKASSWLEAHLPKIQEIYKDKKAVIDLLNEIKEEVDIDKVWYANFIKEVKSRKDVKLLEYLYDIFLSGEGLVVDYPEGQTYETNWKKRYKNKFKESLEKGE